MKLSIRSRSVPRHANTLECWQSLSISKKTTYVGIADLLVRGLSATLTYVPVQTDSRDIASDVASATSSKYCSACWCRYKFRDLIRRICEQAWNVVSQNREDLPRCANRKLQQCSIVCVSMWVNFRECVEWNFCSYKIWYDLVSKIRATDHGFSKKANIRYDFGDLHWYILRSQHVVRWNL